MIAETYIPNPNNFTRVDHINCDASDNRIENIRWCNLQGNNANKPKRKGNWSSKYKGVSWDKLQKKWAVHTSLYHKSKTEGRFDNEIEAAKYYDKRAKELYGEFAHTNF